MTPIRVSNAGRGEILEGCRRGIDAQSIALCHVDERGEIAIIALTGTGPEMSLLSEVMTNAPRHTRHSFQFKRTVNSNEVLITGRGNHFLAAIFAGESTPDAGDVVDGIAQRLLPAHRTQKQKEQRAPLGPLVLPREMIVGPSPAMQRLLAEISATVSSSLDVLLSGETGTGKELFARLVHASGPTGGGPFVAINCAAIPSELLEAELFGVERNVATGVDPRRGLFLEADGGSMFLDEIAELPERLQAKLLRVLQEREVLPLGAKRPRPISVRIISASNRQLATFIAAGRFRADLYYRLRGLEFHIPALRERTEDIPILILDLLTRAADEYGKRINGITSSALRLLQTYPWPGNIRELQSEIRRAALLCEPEAALDEPLFASLKTPAQPPALEHNEPALPTMTLPQRLAALEKQEIERALIACAGNHSRAARMLGITRNGLTSKLRRLGAEVRK